MRKRKTSSSTTLREHFLNEAIEHAQLAREQFARKKYTEAESSLAFALIYRGMAHGDKRAVSIPEAYEHAGRMIKNARGKNPNHDKTR